MNAITEPNNCIKAQQKTVTDIGINLSAARDVLLSSSNQENHTAESSLISKTIPIKFFFILSIISLYFLSFVCIPVFKLYSLLVIPMIAALYYSYYIKEGLQKLGIGWIAHLTIAGFITASIEYSITNDAFRSIFFALLPLPFLFIHLMYFYTMTRAFFLLNRHRTFIEQFPQNIFVFKYNDGTFEPCRSEQEGVDLTLSQYIFSDLDIFKNLKPALKKYLRLTVCGLWTVFLSIMLYRYAYAKALPYVPLSGDIHFNINIEVPSSYQEKYNIYADINNSKFKAGYSTEIKTSIDAEANLMVYVKKDNILTANNSISIPINELDLSKTNRFKLRLNINEKNIPISLSLRRKLSLYDIYRAFLNK